MKVVVVTGANRGVGYGIAKSFFDTGYKVIGLNRTYCKESWLEEIQCDVSRKHDLEKAIDEIVRKYGRIDIVVNNAAVRRFARISEISDQDWEDSLNTNLSAPLWLIRKTTKWLIESNGLLVFIGSHAGEYPFEKGAAYSSTKAALHAMAEVSIQDLRFQGIRICCLSLGAIANRPMEDDEWKMQPSDVGQLVVSLSNLPPRVMPAYVEMRPSIPKRSPISGMETLQYI